MDAVTWSCQSTSTTRCMVFCVCVCNDIMLLKGMPIEEVYAVGIGGVVSLLLATL